MSDDEKTMREAKVPTLESPEELSAYIADLIDREHDYGTAVYAISMAATATFNHVAKKLGVTGWQASNADLDILRRTRNLPGPFMLIDADKALFPQYSLAADLEAFLIDIKPWLAEQAAKKLANDIDGPVSPKVVDHWRTLAAWKENDHE